MLAIVGIAVIIFARKSSAASARKEYISNLNIARATMLQGAADAEETCNLINSVWHNAIFKKSDASTDKYTRKPGVSSSKKKKHSMMISMMLWAIYLIPMNIKILFLKLRVRTLLWKTI